MKKLGGLFVLLSLSVVSFGEELPKASFGRYGGEMPAYTVIVDGQTIAISSHDVFITVSAEAVIYSGGNLEMTGSYTVYKQSKNEYVIKANLTNGKSVNYELDFTWKKKDNKIYITPKNGQSEAILERIGD